MKAGAVDFLVKPISNDVLLGAIRQGLERSRVALDREIRDARPSELLRVTHSSRTASHGTGGFRLVE